MSNYATLKSAISAAIKQNGNEEITGQVLQTTLLGMVDSLAAGFLFKGIATPDTVVGTPDENVFWIGGAGTYNNFGSTPVAVPVGCIGVFCYNGSFTNTVLQNDGVLDVSVLNASGTPLTPATYASLSAALAVVPASLQRGGMEIIYIDSTTTKYVKYRLMTTSWSTTVSDWQGVDEEPTQNSENLTISKGVYNWFSCLKNTHVEKLVPLSISEAKYININEAGAESSANDYCTAYYDVENIKDTFLFMTITLNGSSIPLFAYYDENDNYLGYYRPYSEGYKVVNDELMVLLNIPAGCKYVGTSNFGSNVNYGTINVLSIKGIEDEVQKNASDITNLFNKNNLVVFPRKQYQGYFDITDFTLKYNDVYLTKYYLVKDIQDRMVIANAYISGSSIGELVYYDASMNYISHQYNAPSGVESDFVMFPNIPANAVYCSITGIGYTQPERTKMTCYAPNENALKEKQIIFDGDSICAALPFTMGGWAKRIGIHNIMDWHNEGVSGGVIVETDYEDSPLGRDRHSVVANIDNIYANYPDLDYLILEGGTNDADHNKMGNIQTGTYQENEFRVAQFDAKTFYGALDTLFYKALTYFPHAKIGFIIAQKMGFSNTEWVEHRREYFDIIIQECEKWGIPYIDLWKHGQLRPDVDSMAQEYPAKTPEEAEEFGLAYYDGQHLTNYGYDVITPKIEAWIKTL